MEWGHSKMALSGQEFGSTIRQTHDADAASASASDTDFAAIIPLYATAILRVAAALVGPADAEDAAQEAITRGWQAWPTLRDTSAARSWLLRITVNVCRDWQRGRFGTRRRLTEPLYDDDAAPLALLGGDPGASDHANAMDLRGAIDTLDEDLRLVVVLRYYSGMDATEVGAILGIPPATVRTRLRRALRMLRGQMSTSSGVYAKPPEQGDAHGG
ncbi:MAG TPA: sigma-70 family RNA polymerase sigma factor [Ktedonobacterales bacterium]